MKRFSLVLWILALQIGLSICFAQEIETIYQHQIPLDSLQWPYQSEVIGNRIYVADDNGVSVFEYQNPKQIKPLSRFSNLEHRSLKYQKMFSYEGKLLVGNVSNIRELNIKTGALTQYVPKDRGSFEFYTKKELNGLLAQIKEVADNDTDGYVTRDGRLLITKYIVSEDGSKKVDVFVFDAHKKYIETWQSAKTNLLTVVNITSDQEGNFYFADTCHRKVVKLSGKGNPIAEYYDTMYQDVAELPDNKMLAIGNDHRLTFLTKDLKLIQTYGKSVASDPKCLNEVRDIVSDKFGNRFFRSGQNSSVVKVQPSIVGADIPYILDMGYNPTNGLVYVLTNTGCAPYQVYENASLNQLDATGNFINLDSLEGKGYYLRPICFTMDYNGNYYIMGKPGKLNDGIYESEHLKASIVKFTMDSKGKLKPVKSIRIGDASQFNNPKMAVDSKNNLYVSKTADSKGMELYKYDNDLKMLDSFHLNVPFDSGYDRVLSKFNIDSKDRLSFIDSASNAIREMDLATGQSKLLSFGDMDLKVVSGFWGDFNGNFYIADLDQNIYRMSSNASKSPMYQTVFKQPTQAEILKKWSQLKVKNSPRIYESTPVIAQKANELYTCGFMNPSFNTDGLQMINFFRYIAGLSNTVQEDPYLSRSASVGAYALNKHQKLTHTPPKPKEMDDWTYETALEGTTLGNIGMGYTSLWASQVGYMDERNNAFGFNTGHRRMILNPQLGLVGFGYVGNATVTRSADLSQTFIPDYEYISWPSANTPTALFSSNGIWSVTLNPLKYDNSKLTKLRITMSDEKTGKVISRLDSSSKSFVCSNDRSGIPFNITFRPAIATEVKNGKTYKVLVEGLYDKFGNMQTVSYTVRFFDGVTLPKL